MNAHTYSHLAPQPTWNSAAAGAVELISEATPMPAISVNEIRHKFTRVEGLVTIDARVMQVPDPDLDQVVDAWARTGHAAYAYARNTGHSFSWDELTSTLVRKQRDYGHQNIARFGLLGLVVRCHDKIARLENLVTRGLEPGNESLKDNLLDVAGYAAIGIMWAAETFLLELE